MNKYNLINYMTKSNNSKQNISIHTLILSLSIVLNITLVLTIAYHFIIKPIPFLCGQTNQEVILQTNDQPDN